MADGTQFLRELAQKWQEWMDSNRKVGVEDWIKMMLTDLYSDKAHFIYELLQNAEDAQATRVSFKLNQDRLEFRHDGRRLFSEKDVESIISIGKSTKGDDHTNIGKFGVGFKAVFAYTNTPEIHSNGFHFRIRDLFVPEIVQAQPSTEWGTRFVFPFNKPGKDPKKAYDEIKNGLSELREGVACPPKRVPVGVRKPVGFSGLGGISHERQAVQRGADNRDTEGG